MSTPSDIPAADLHRLASLLGWELAPGEVPAPAWLWLKDEGVWALYYGRHYEAWFGADNEDAHAIPHTTDPLEALAAAIAALETP